MDKVAPSIFDEYYTPIQPIKCLLKYLKPNSCIWCPFDKSDSNFVKVLSSNGFEIIFTHKDVNNGNFFDLIHNYNYDYDYIISNPPYSLKGQILEKLFESKSKFAMLVGIVGLFESKHRFNIFKTNNFELMYFNKRISYMKNNNEVKPSINPPFSSVFVTSGILPNQIIFEELESYSL